MNVYFAVIRMFYVSVLSSSVCSAEIHYSLLSLCLDDVFIVESGVLKSPIIIVLLLISTFSSVNFCFIDMGAPMLDTHNLQLLNLLDELAPLSSYSDHLCLYPVF